MKVKGILLVAVGLMVLSGIAQAQEEELHGVIDVTWGSKYLWRGFDIYDDHAAIHPGVMVDLYGTGFGVGAVMHRACSSGFENGERWDYNVSYKNVLFGDESYATSYMLNYVYYNYPDSDSADFDLQEANAMFSWPKILGIEGLVRSYVLVKLWPSSSGSMVGANNPFGGTASGWAHIFMLDYGLHVQCPITGEDRVLNLHSEMIYNDGVMPACGPAVDSDWSNAVFGISTDFDLDNNLTFTPGIYYQSSWEDTVNTEDEYWATLSLKYKF